MVILIAEDEQSIRRALELILKSEHDVICCEDGRKALAELSRTNIDLVITDYQMPFLSGLELIKQGKELSPSTAFILMTAFGSTNQAVEAIQLGADDYFSKPFDVSEMKHRIRKIEELRNYKIEKTSNLEDVAKKLVGKSSFAQQATKFITAAASSTSAILLSGPQGVGKEFMARAIHESGHRSIYPLIMLDCASLTEENGEEELFGIERDTSQKSATPKRGKIELARGGTLILREVSALSPSLQQKLIPVLRDNTFVRVSGSRKVQSNTRIIATSSLPLKPLVDSGAFSTELFYLLNILEMNLPSLKERSEDIPAFVDFFWSKLNRQLKNKLSIPDETKAQLSAYPFPGNLRELKNVLERLAVLATQSGAVTTDLLPNEFKSGASLSHSKAERTNPQRGLAAQLQSFEKQILFQAMQEMDQNEFEAAKYLEIDVEDLKKRLKSHGWTASKKAA